MTRIDVAAGVMVALGWMAILGPWFPLWVSPMPRLSGLGVVVAIIGILVLMRQPESAR